MLLKRNWQCGAIILLDMGVCDELADLQNEPIQPISGNRLR